MTGDGAFLQLMQRLRVGDEKAAVELHALYAEQLQRIVRVRLTQPALRRQMDSIDICQSVFADFFLRTAMGQYDPRSPAELLRLLAAMARHRLLYHARKQKAARRDMRRVEAGAIEDLSLAGGGASPSQIISARELLQRCQQRLNDEERSRLEMRRAGQGWDEIGLAVGKTGEAVRKQFGRSMKRVSDELGIEEFARE
ncbi:MAG TPA: ECF-type sigma factor [Planctomycetaceae bacterium]|nr:ECF-type sigma factor [Planctomycetaceae bacterium]